MAPSYPDDNGKRQRGNTLTELYVRLQDHPKSKKNGHYKNRIRATIYKHRSQYTYLETQIRARTVQAQTVCRARILLLRAGGISINDIADKVGINRCSVMLCVNKFKEGGVENALFDAPGRGCNAEIADDEKAWIN